MTSLTIRHQRPRDPMGVLVDSVLLFGCKFFKPIGGPLYFTIICYHSSKLNKDKRFSRPIASVQSSDVLTGQEP